MIAYFKEIYDYRAMIKSTVRKDLRGRYKASVLGFLWTFINPLLQLLVYTFVFGIIMPNDIDKYYLHLFVALVPWIFFSSSITGGASLIIQQQDLIKKIYFPRQIVPLSYTITNLVNMLLSMLVVFLVLLVSGQGITYAVIYLPIVILVQFIMCLGITFVTSACTVYFRDLEHILGIVSMALQFMSPVMYPISIVPEQYLSVYMLNPMTPIISAYRDILYYGQAPQLSTLALGAIMGVVVLVVGTILFNKLQKNFAEEL